MQAEFAHTVLSLLYHAKLRRLWHLHDKRHYKYNELASILSKGRTSC
jgi:hypothetical protein